jgi:Phytochelatin synthase
LVLDVARFKYPTYWVDVELLWESMLPLDSSSKRSRGYAVLSKGKEQCVKCYSQLNVDAQSWKGLHDLLYTQIPKEVQKLSPSATVKDYFTKIVDLIPTDYESVVENRTLMFTENEGTLRPESDEAIKNYVQGVGTLLLEVSKLKIYRYVDKISQARRKLQTEPSFSPVTAISCSPMITTLIQRPSLSFLSKPHRSRMASFTSQLSSRASVIELLPIRDDVDNQSAFLTIFLLAFLSFCPATFKLLKNNALSLEIEILITIDNPDVAREISLLRNQIEALNEYITTEKNRIL